MKFIETLAPDGTTVAVNINSVKYIRECPDGSAIVVILGDVERESLYSYARLMAALARVS